MNCVCVDYYDNFEDEVIFYVLISGVPRDIQDAARLADTEEYSPECFGTCARYVVDEEKFELAPDDKDTNIYYTTNEGDRVWYFTQLTDEFIAGVFALCDEKLKTEPKLRALTDAAGICEGKI